jgi:hypothetical protein
MPASLKKKVGGELKVVLNARDSQIVGGRGIESQFSMPVIPKKVGGRELKVVLNARGPQKNRKKGIERGSRCP